MGEREGQRAGNVKFCENQVKRGEEMEGGKGEK